MNISQTLITTLGVSLLIAIIYVCIYKKSFPQPYFYSKKFKDKILSLNHFVQEDINNRLLYVFESEPGLALGCDSIHTDLVKKMLKKYDEKKDYDSLKFAKKYMKWFKIPQNQLLEVGHSYMVTKSRSGITLLEITTTR